MLDADILPDDPKNIDAEDAVKILASQVAQTMPGIDVEVILSDGIVSDAAAGANNIKLNQDVKFSQRELDILEVHEGWIHVGTTQNGLARHCCLIKAHQLYGYPRRPCGVDRNYYLKVDASTFSKIS